MGSGSLARRFEFRHGIKGLNGVGLYLPARVNGYRGSGRPWGSDPFDDPARGDGGEILRGSVGRDWQRGVGFVGEDDFRHGRRGLLQGVSGLDADPPMTVDLPNGSSDVVLGTTSDGMIFTQAGWQSIPGPDEKWVNVYTAEIMLSDGSIIPPSTTTPSGDTVGTILDQVVRAGNTLATGVTQILETLGVGSGGGGTWVSGTQYRLGNGQVVTPTRLPNGTYRLPDGTIVGAPSSASGVGLALAVGAVAMGIAWVLGRRRG